MIVTVNERLSQNGVMLPEETRFGRQPRRTGAWSAVTTIILRKY